MYIEHELTLKQVAVAIGLCEATTKKLLEEADIPIRRRGTYSRTARRIVVHPGSFAGPSRTQNR